MGHLLKNRFTEKLMLNVVGDCSPPQANKKKGLGRLARPLSMEVNRELTKPVAKEILCVIFCAVRPLVLLNRYKGFFFSWLVGVGWREVLYSRSRAQFWAQ